MKKVITNFNNYSILTTGAVINNSTGRTLARGTNGQGYIQYKLKNNDGIYQKCYAHLLVADAYLPAEPGKSQVNHIDKNPGNCDLSNLERVSPAGNRAHAKLTRENTTSKYIGVCLNKGKYIARIMVNKVYKYLGSFTNELDAYAAYIAEAEKQNTITKYHYQFA